MNFDQPKRNSEIMPPRCAESRIDGLTIRDLADELNLPKSTVQDRYRKAKIILSEALKQYAPVK